VTAAELEHILETTAFTASYGFRLGPFSRGSCSLLIPYNPLYQRPGGIVSGQVYMAAADVAAWLAIKTVWGAADQSVTIEMTTSFLASLSQADFTCHSEIVKGGSSATFLVARCVSGDGRILTHHTMRYLRSAKRRRETEPPVRQPTI
jgi:acyl-coenzyme A thioesterase PaaI-like protein